MNDMNDDITEFIVPLLHDGNPAGSGVFDVHGYEQPCRLTLTFLDRTISTTADSYFEAMQRIRHVIEPEGFRLLCYGGSLRCYPSPMALDMGDGSVVYRTELGRHAMTKDLVNIFATGPDVEPSSVAEQNAYHEKWMRSFTSAT